MPGLMAKALGSLLQGGRDVAVLACQMKSLCSGRKMSTTITECCPPLGGSASSYSWSISFDRIEDAARFHDLLLRIMSSGASDE